MRFTLPFLRRIRAALRQRDWFGIGFELFVVVLGVVLGLEASRWSAESQERAYRQQMLAALDSTLLVYTQAGEEIHDELAGKLTAFQRSRAAGQHIAPPYWRLDRLERPPTLAWDAMVATGIARSLKAEDVFQIARFFSTGDALGDRYQRYNAFVESELLPFLDDPHHFYSDDGRLRPTYRANLDRLRELLALNDFLTSEATRIRRIIANSKDG